MPRRLERPPSEDGRRSAWRAATARWRRWQGWPSNDLPLVVVPTGTLNHFASDVGLSVAQPPALEAFDGRELRVDVGRANGRLFVNNLSVGVYAEAVGHPDYRRHKLRTGWRALQRALAEPENAAGLRVRSPGEAPVEEVLMAVIANNPHHLRRDARLGRRPRLDTGMLQVTAAPVPSVSRLMRSLAAELGVPIANPPSPRQWLSRHAECEDRVVGSVRAGVDGESVVFTGPVAAWAEPGALRLLVPDAPTPQVGRRRYRVGRLRRWLSLPAPPVL